MKRNITGLVSFAFIGLSVLMTGCSKNDSTPPNTDKYNIAASLNAANEVKTPALSTVTFPGTGTMTGTYNSTTNLLTYSISWTGLSGTATASHFHGPALTTENAAVQVGFTLAGNSASGTATLDETQESQLLTGKWYANVHTTANPGGEIRGQVTATLQ